MTEFPMLSVLFIEPNPRITAQNQRLLEESPYLPTVSIIIARTLNEALFQIDDRSFDLILVNLFLPDSKGLETFLTISQKADQSAIIVMAKEGMESIAFDAISLGAEDYLLEEENDLYTVSRNIRNALERHGLKESLKAMTFTDELTSIYNRRGFLTIAKQQLDLARREQRELNLFLIDLDHLKEINDNYGHKIGDDALIACALCLKKTFRASDIIARIGGDEFAVLALGSSFYEGEKIGEHLNYIVDQFNEANPNQQYVLALSFGKAHFHPENQYVIEDLLQQADLELYIAKKISHKKIK